MSRLSLAAGVLRVVAQARPPRAELELRTPTAIAAAPRGTQYLAEVKPGGDQPSVEPPWEPPWP